MKLYRDPEISTKKALTYYKFKFKFLNTFDKISNTFDESTFIRITIGYESDRTQINKSLNKKLRKQIPLFNGICFVLNYFINCK